MWDCIKECVLDVLPGAGWVALSLIVGGLILIVITGPIAVTAGSVAAVIGTACGSTAIGTLVGCLRACW